MNQDFKDKIIESVKKGGWIAELNAGETLNSREWQTISNYIYYDNEKKVAREIDLFATISSDFKFMFEFEVKITLVIEVKKSKNPWIFFLGKNEYPTLELSFFSVVNYSNITQTTVENLFIDFPSQNIPYISTSHTEAFREHDISNIYKAIESVTKATSYFHRKDPIAKKIPLREGEKADDLFEGINFEKPSKLNIYLPIIILDGFLIEAFLDKKAGIEITESNHIPYLNHAIDANGIEQLYTIDIITLANFDEYLKNIESWAEKQNHFLQTQRNL